MEGNAQAQEPSNSEESGNLFDGNVPIRTALEQLRLRLLDLTGRNRLINFKHTPGKSLRFVHTHLDTAFQRLAVEGSGRVTISALPEPEQSEWVSVNGRLTRPEPMGYAKSIGLDHSYDLSPSPNRSVASIGAPTQARTLFYAEDLGRHCRKIERDARLAIEETGANMLYLVFGFLDFPESPAGERTYQAPLVCVPVRIERTQERQYTTFHLHASGEEIADNLSLREKLRRDFGVSLPEFDADGDQSVGSYLDSVQEVVRTLPNWRLHRMMTLTLLSFTNMLLVRDLDPDRWPALDGESSLLMHPIIRQVFEGKREAGDATYGEEYPIDEHPQRDIPLIADADSSQHSALIDVLDGKNRVIEGPPGTGKSQTITNLIAAALNAGKTVLFVAEKLAALEVVKSRLQHVGLAPFLLELHSNKTNRKKVLESLDERIKLRVAVQATLPSMLERHEEKRRVLKTYVELMATRHAFGFDITLHQVMWRSELNRLRCGDETRGLEQLAYPPAVTTTQTQFEILCDRLRNLEDHFQRIGAYDHTHPMWGFFPTEFRPEAELAVGHVLTTVAEKFEAFHAATTEFAAFLGTNHIRLPRESAGQLLGVLSNIAPADVNDVDYAVLPALFSQSDPTGERSKAILEDFTQRREEVAKLEDAIARCLVTGSSASAEAAAAAKPVILELKRRGIARNTQATLRVKAQQLGECVARAAAALHQLESLSNLLGFAFAGSVDDVSRLRQLSQCFAVAPLEAIELRHDGVSSDSAAATIKDLMGRLVQIQSEQQALDATLYLDAVPSQEVLRSSILTLREGDAWYRIFQSEWRRSVRTHRTLARNKARVPVTARLAELERLATHLETQQEWVSDPELGRVGGPFANGEKTPLQGLYKCAQWLSLADASYAAAAVQPQQFDLLRVEASTLRRVSAESQKIPAACEALSEFYSLTRSLEQGALQSIQSAFAEGTWTTRVQLANQTLGHLKAAIDLAAMYLTPEADLGEGLETLVVFPELASMRAAIEQHQGMQSLLGVKYVGRLTNLEPILSAYAYGNQVRSAELPAKLENVLLAQNCVETHGELVRMTRAVNQGWQFVQSFAHEMGRHGTYDASLWVDDDLKSTIEYSRLLAEKTRRAASSLDGLLAWCQYVRARTELTEAGLSAFLSALECKSVPVGRLRFAFSSRFYAAIAKAAFERFPALRQFSGVSHTALREEYAALDREIIELRGKEVARTCMAHSRPPIGSYGTRVDDKTEMALLEHLIPQQRPRVPVRRMMARAGKAIQALKPCFMMGPQAVAQFLNPASVKFDIVVMDEASQLKPEQAIGSIARGGQLVVVGDPKQLPPTSFFSRNAASEGDEDGVTQMATTEAESILDVCIAHFQPVRTLRWHYRSRHESLIAFSNHFFYKRSLFVFPSPYPKTKALGLRYHYVRDGVYDSQMNPVEAKHVVDAAVEHILQRPGDSLGIVTLNIKQRDVVAELLEERLRYLPEAGAFNAKWEAEGMPLFVKNLENVQGDERDSIIISTTFGRPPGGTAPRQNFGPISRQGGWRRLNVLFTRARRSIAIYSSMTPAQIVVDGQTPEGTRALRNFLEYARTGNLPIEQETNAEPDSEFEVAVMEVLRQKGYEVVPQLGVAGFRIDIAVRHPAQRSGYLAAIECDGATYHSGVSVRDRDRIRQDILEGLGWKGRIWRIWSTDWFRNARQETARLLAFLQQLRDQPVPEEYLAETVEPAAQEELVDTGLPTSTIEVVETPEILTDDDDLEVEVGDMVTYFLEGHPDEPVQVTLTTHQTDLQSGLLAERAPLGSILIGACVGESVVLRVPGQPPKTYVVAAIKRQ